MSDFPQQIKVQVQFGIGEIVYIITDLDQEKYVVLGYLVRFNEVLYDVHNHSYGSYIAYDYELSRTKEL